MLQIRNSACEPRLFPQTAVAKGLMSLTESSLAALDLVNVVATEILNHDQSIDWEIVYSAFTCRVW